MKKNLFAALALVASMAFATASHAGTVPVAISESFSATAPVGSNTISSITLTFTGLTGITDLTFNGIAFSTQAGTVTPIFTTGAESVTVHLNPHVFLVSGTVSFTTQVNALLLNNLSDLSNSIKLQSVTVVNPAGVTITPSGPYFSAVVPEPTSSAMFGIGIVLAVGLGWGRKRRELAKLAA